MNCFNHRERPALGICKSCGKGLCEECLQEVPNGIACKAECCEKRVALLNKMVDAYPQTLAAGRKTLKRNAFFHLASGLFFLLLSVIALLRVNVFLFGFMGIMGMLFLIFGIVALRRGNQYPAE